MKRTHSKCRTSLGEAMPYVNIFALFISLLFFTGCSTDLNLKSNSESIVNLYNSKKLNTFKGTVIGIEEYEKADVVRIYVYVASVKETPPHPSIIGEIDFATFRVKSIVPAQNWPFQAIEFRYDQHNLLKSKKFILGEAWVFFFTKSGDFIDFFPI
jgi:hypothetical protein